MMTEKRNETASQGYLYTSSDIITDTVTFRCLQCQNRSATCGPPTIKITNFP